MLRNQARHDPGRRRQFAPEAPAPCRRDRRRGGGGRPRRAGLAPAAGAATQRDTGQQAHAKNVIIMISDGCGYDHIAATDYFVAGRLRVQPYEHFPVRVAMSTHSFYGYIQPVHRLEYLRLGQERRDRLGRRRHRDVERHQDEKRGDRRRLSTTLRCASSASVPRSSARRRVWSPCQWSHATPAGFVAHNPSRGDYAASAPGDDHSSATDVIMGAGNPGSTTTGSPRRPRSSKYVGGRPLERPEGRR